MIEEPVNRYLSDHDIWDCQPENAQRDYISEWKMSAEGLKCQYVKPLDITTDSTSVGSR